MMVVGRGGGGDDMDVTVSVVQSGFDEQATRNGLLLFSYTTTVDRRTSNT